MNIKKEIEELNNIKVEYDSSLAQKKLNRILLLIQYIERSILTREIEIQREDIISSIEQVRWLSYEIGSIRQPVDSNKYIEIIQKTLTIAKLVFGKTAEVLPYLYLFLHNSFRNQELHNSLQKEIQEIEEGIKK